MALTDGLIAYYKLDSAGITADAHGANTLTNNNSTPTTTGKINQAGDFLAASSRSLSVTLAAMDSAAAFSLTFWFQRANASHTITVGTRGSTTNRTNVMIWTDGNVYFQIGTGGNYYGSVAHGISTGAWGFMAMTFDGSQGTTANRTKGYVNGTQQTLSFPNGSPGTTLASNANQGPFYIGLETSTRYSTGQIDEVGVWNRAITGAEVTALYNGGAGLAYPFSAGAAANYYRNYLAMSGL